jgi:rhodanese-related sulfurtransferase
MKKAVFRRPLVAFGVATLVLCLGSLVRADEAIAPNEAAKLIKEKKNILLIDVRTPAEYAEEHLVKAKLVPLQELEERVAELQKGKPILLYCRSGHRSGMALKILQDKGFTQAKHIEGGINAWKAAGLPVTK